MDESNNERGNHFSQLISVNIKEISDSVSGTVKKIETQAKWCLSYKKDGFHISLKELLLSKGPPRMNDSHKVNIFK